MIATVKNPDHHGERQIANQQGTSVGSIVYGQDSVRPYAVYQTGRGFVSKHAFFGDARDAAKAHFDKLPAE